MNETFKPAWWLPSPHGQTIWPVFFRRPSSIEEQWERLELPDEDFLDLVWDKRNYLDEGKPIVILLHGLGGGITSTYIKDLMTAISQCGFRPVLMHYRGASGVPNRLPKGYHSGETGDIGYVAGVLKERCKSPLACVGFSIGGNILIKWLGETGSDNPLSAAVAVSVPFELPAVADKLMQGFSQVYQQYLLRKLIKDKKIKFSTMPSPIDLSGLDSISNFWEYDSLVTAPIFGFADVHEYYRKSSSRQYLPGITVPTLIIHAEDDPFMTPKVVPQVNELSKSTQLNLSPKGGHVGFICGNTPGIPEYWLDRRIPAFLKSIL